MMREREKERESWKKEREALRGGRQPTVSFFLLVSNLGFNSLKPKLLIIITDFIFLSTAIREWL